MSVEDLADKVDDLICAWDKVVGSDIETVVILILGWLVFGGVIFLVSHLIYSTLGTVEEGSSSPPVSMTCSPPDLVPTLSVSPPSHQDYPTAVGSDPDCVTFVNSCLEFLYSNPVARQDILDRWREKLTEFAKRSAEEEDLCVEFLTLPYSSEDADITLSYLTVTSLPGENMTLTGDLSATTSILLRTVNRVGDSLVSMDYMMNIDRIRARLSITFITAEQLMIVKFEGWPDIKMRLSPISVPPCLSSKADSLGTAVGDVAAQAIRGVQLDIRTNTINNFPVFKRTVFPSNSQNKSSPSRSLHSVGGTRPCRTEVTGIGNHCKARQVVVKGIKATQLGGGCVQPYVVLEVDEPSQRYQTKAGTGQLCSWEDTFNIEITKVSSELLFEVWDQAGESELFLGLTIVSVSELMITPSQRHVLPLQGRPGHQDQVTGLLTIQFLVKDAGLSWEDKDLLPGVYRTFESKEKQPQPGKSVVEKKTVYSRQASQVPDLLTGSSVPAMALKDISINKARKGNKEPTKSTLIMHSVQTIASQHSDNSINYGKGDSTTTTDYTDDASDSVGNASITSKDSALNKCQRGRRTKRNLLSSIKNRFKGTRSLSSTGMDYPDSPHTDLGRISLLPPGPTRVRSASEHRHEDTGHDGSECPSTDTDSGCSLTLPSWRGSLSLSWEADLHLSLPTHDGSSMSDVSGISTTSNKTYVSEDSSLVLETLESGHHHHYLIPMTAARRGKFKKAGTKLHIYMDHIFTAQHIKLGTKCDACSRVIPLRLGKQAYVCRDCGTTTHKQCHTKVDTHCLQTTLPTMELEFYSEDSVTKIHH